MLRKTTGKVATCFFHAVCTLPCSPLLVDFRGAQLQTFSSCVPSSRRGKHQELCACPGVASLPPADLQSSLRCLRMARSGDTFTFAVKFATADFTENLKPQLTTLSCRKCAHFQRTRAQA